MHQLKYLQMCTSITRVHRQHTIQPGKHAHVQHTHAPPHSTYVIDDHATHSGLSLARAAKAARSQIARTTSSWISRLCRSSPE